MPRCCRVQKCTKLFADVRFSTRQNRAFPSNAKNADWNDACWRFIMKTNMLKCGLLPGESPPVVLRLNEPLRAYLERRLHMPVELVVGKNYVATGEALRRGMLDIAYLGPITYILQSRVAPLEAFARPTHGGSIGPTFKAALIVPQASRARTLADLRGGEIALGDLASTSGSWVPRHMLLTAGLAQDKDYTRRHLGAHDAVVDAVARCQVAAGGLSLTVFRRLLAEGMPAAGAVRILAESPPIPEYMWTFRAGLPAALRDEVRAAFHTLAEPQPLAAFAATAFIPAVDPDVDRVRHWMEELLETRLFSGDPILSTPEFVRAAA
jgi:phosphonate transport system substrate-binding protein